MKITTKTKAVFGHFLQHLALETDQASCYSPGIVTVAVYKW